MKYSVIITAGGASTRFGNNRNKLLEKINDKEIIKYTIEAFSNELIDEIIIPTNKNIIAYLMKIFDNNSKIKIIEGGLTRQESVYKALQYVKNPYVLIHDGARPMITAEIISNILLQLPQKNALSVMTKTIDTIKEVEVHEKLKDQNFTDDAGMVEACGYPVYMIEGDYKNIKITTEEDLIVAKNYLL